MAGNSQRKGARRTTGSKKGAVVGSGGQRSKGLAGRGPTPKATERTGHPAARTSSAASRREGTGRGESRPSGASGPRGKTGVELITGRNSVVEALRGGVPASALYVAERVDADERVREAIKRAADLGLPLLEVPRHELDRLTERAVHQGLALQVPPYTYAHPDDLIRRARDAGHPALVVALDGVTDPRNLGAVVRSAAAFGADGVLVPERRSAGMTSGAWKTSAGAATHVPVARATNLTRTLESYQEQGLTVVGLAGEGGIALHDLDVAADPVVVVVGSEGQGLSRLVERSCDLLVRIPISGAVESLNAGVAAGIVLYEVSRRRS